MTPIDSSSTTGMTPPPLPTASDLQPKSSGMAITSLVLGITGVVFCGLLGLVGLPLGIVALKRINQSGGRTTGQGFAITGICVSSLSLFVLLMQVGLLLPALSKAQRNAKVLRTQAQLTQVGAAFEQYALVHNDLTPPADEWIEALAEHGITDQLLTSIFAAEEGRAFAMNAALTDRSMLDLSDPGNTVLVFECASGSPPSGSREILPLVPRSGRGFLILFVSGEAVELDPSAIDSLIWEP